jgi:hypothetical protein
VGQRHPPPLSCPIPQHSSANPELKKAVVNHFDAWQLLSTVGQRHPPPLSCPIPQHSSANPELKKAVVNHFDAWQLL